MATTIVSNETRRFNLAIDAKLGDIVTTLSEHERRPINSMFEVLLIEALANRGVIDQPKPPKFTLD